MSSIRGGWNVARNQKTKWNESCIFGDFVLNHGSTQCHPCHLSFVCVCECVCENVISFAILLFAYTVWKQEKLKERQRGWAWETRTMTTILGQSIQTVFGNIPTPSNFLTALCFVYCSCIHQSTLCIVLFVAIRKIEFVRHFKRTVTADAHK